VNIGIEQLGLSYERKRKVKSVLAVIGAATILAVPFHTSADERKSDDDGKGHHHQHNLLACDDTMKSQFKSDSLTTVLLVKAFKKGEPLALSGTPATPPPAIAANDVCVVKLLVGPGNPGPAGAPSTSAGIGIEVWLPAPANWSRRIHVIGGGGWQGGVHTSLTLLAGAGNNGTTPAPATVATVEGAVSATTDTGHTVPGTGSFAMNPEGTINTVLWNDFSQRGIHEMAVQTKELTQAYYGKHAEYAYWDGFSTGGRQGHKLAQAHPGDFDGILAGAPAFNWTRFITNELYPQIVAQRDLGGVGVTIGQMSLLGNAAINACDVVNGQHLGYIPDPSECRYDPTHDASVLCASSGGANTTANCVTPVQAQAMNKMWYGQTRDGTAPPPTVDNSWSHTVGGSHLWYGLARGSNMAALAGATPFTISSDMVALEDQNPTLATPSFTNATGNGANGWKGLSYEQLAAAYDNGVMLQPSFAHINTDDPNLRPFRNAGGKMLIYHGLADVLIMPQGSINYYEQVLREMDGLHAVKKFYRLFLVPGMTHGLGNGTPNPNANPPLPGGVGASGTTQLYDVLTEWVEKGRAPTRIDISSAVTTTFPVAKSRPICVYPKKATYVGGDINVASSYVCAD